MIENPVASELMRVTTDVLETMFYQSVDDIRPAGETLAIGCIGAGLSFSGARNGQVAIWLPEEAVLDLARSFLGTSEVTREAALDSFRELSNVVCGAILTNAHPNEEFALSSPELLSSSIKKEGQYEAYSFDLGTSVLTVEVLLECIQ